MPRRQHEKRVKLFAMEILVVFMSQRFIASECTFSWLYSSRILDEDDRARSWRVFFSRRTWRFGPAPAPSPLWCRSKRRIIYPCQGSQSVATKYASIRTPVCHRLMRKCHKSLRRRRVEALWALGCWAEKATRTRAASVAAPLRWFF